MNLSIYLIVIIIVLIFFFYKDKELFTIKTDSITGPNKDISETYDYANCIGCITYDNKLKPGFKYLISDNRCVKNITPRYIGTSYINNLNSYTGLPNSELGSCYTDYNSMYSSVNGRYILMFRQDFIKMRFSHISIHKRDTTANSLSIGATIFTINLEKNATGNYVYPESVLDSPNTNTTFEMGPVVNYHTSHTLITLPANADIGYINIKHKNDVDAATFNGVVIVIMRDGITIMDGNMPTARVVFHTTLNTTELNRIIYTYNRLNSPLPEFVSEYMPTLYQWTIPCDNCGSSIGKLFAGHLYQNSTDARCYKPIDNTIDKTVIDSEIPESILTTKFKTCSTVFDTRYMPSIGKFIQITRSDGRNIGINLSKIDLYSDYSNNKYVIGSSDVNGLPLFSALVTTYFNNNSLFENALDGNEATSMITTNSPNSNIHIDLGADTNEFVSAIGFKIPLSERFNIVGLKIQVISIDDIDPFNIQKMTLTCERIITQNDVEIETKEKNDIMSYYYVISLSNNKNELLTMHPEIIINKNVLYDSFNKYLTTYKKELVYYQIPYVIYTMSNGRQVMAKSLSNVVDTLDKINNSDALTLFNLPNSMSSINSQKSYILTPITARYIQVKPGLTNNLINVITSITIYDINKSIIKTVTNPNILYEETIQNYEKYIYDVPSTGSIGFVLIDLESDISITFIKITLSNAQSVTNINNSTVKLINNSNNLVYSYIIKVTTSDDIYIVTDNNVINENNTAFVNKFAYPSCLTNNTCRNVMPNSYYIITEDNTCYKSKSNTICNNTCMTNLITTGKDNTLFESCLTDGTDSRIIKPIIDNPPFWLQMVALLNNTRASNTYSSYPYSHAYSPFYAVKYLSDPWDNSKSCFFRGITGGVRIYTQLPNNVKFKAIRFTNYYNEEFATGNPERGARKVNVYITKIDPTTVYNYGVTSDQLLFSDEIPRNDGVLNPYNGTKYHPGNNFYYPVKNELTGKFIVLDIENNWNSSEGVGISNVEVAISVPTVVTNSVPNLTKELTLPVTGRYIQINRIDNMLSSNNNEEVAIAINEIEIYDISNTKINIVNGTIYPTSLNNNTWDKAIDGFSYTYAECKNNIINEYIRFDLGSDKIIRYIKIKIGRGQDFALQSKHNTIIGCALSVINNNNIILGQFLFQEMLDTYSIGYMAPTVWKTNVWNTVSSDPSTIILKWDTQAIDSVVHINNSFVQNSEQFVKKWKENKTNILDWDFNVYDAHGGNCRFTIDNAGYPGIKLPIGCNLSTGLGRTIYYNGTMFIVFSTTDIKYEFGLFEMGNNWDVRRVPWTSPYISPYTTLVLPNTNAVNAWKIMSSDSSGLNNVNVNNVYNQGIFPSNKRIIIGYRYNIINNNVLEFRTICSTNPNDVYVTSLLSVSNTSNYTNTFTSPNTRYSINSRYNSLKQSGRNYDYPSTYYGDQFLLSASITMHELNIHNTLLSNTDMIAECKRLMSKWGI